MHASSRLPVSAERVMTVLWGGFTAAYVIFFYIFQDAAEIADANLDGYLEVILLGVPTIVLLGGIMWLREADVDDDLRPRMVGWTIAMGLFFAVAMYTAMFVIETQFDRGENWLILLMSLGFGCSSGVVMGALEIRSQQRERERNQSLRVARRKERQRSQLEHLNQYLRHEVLNEAQKIQTYSSLLRDRESLNGQRDEYLETIHHSGREIGTFIQSIRSILEDTDHDPDLEAVDIVSLLESEIERLRGTYDTVEIEFGPDSASVLAGDLLGRVFHNLLENAIKHNDKDISITVTVDADDDWVTVRIRDDGTGIPESKRDALFKPPESGDHGYGLYLMKNLVEVYGGRLELADTGPEGTEFVVRLEPATRFGPSGVKQNVEVAS